MKAETRPYDRISSSFIGQQAGLTSPRRISFIWPIWWPVWYARRPSVYVSWVNAPRTEWRWCDWCFLELSNHRNLYVSREVLTSSDMTNNGDLMTFYAWARLSSIEDESKALASHGEMSTDLTDDLSSLIILTVSKHARSWLDYLPSFETQLEHSCGVPRLYLKSRDNKPCHLIERIIHLVAGFCTTMRERPHAAVRSDACTNLRSWPSTRLEVRRTVLSEWWARTKAFEVR